MYRKIMKMITFDLALTGKIATFESEMQTRVEKIGKNYISGFGPEPKTSGCIRCRIHIYCQKRGGMSRQSFSFSFENSSSTE